MSDGWQSGVFSVSVDMSANAAAGINIVASAFSNQMDVVKAGINNTLTKDGQNVPTSVLPMAGYRHTGTGKAQAVDDYQRVQEYIHMSPIFMADAETGQSCTISCSAVPWPASTSAGMHAMIKMPNRNKPSASAASICLRIGSTSANVSAMDGTRLWPGAFQANSYHEVIYDSATGAFKLINPGTFKVGARLQVKARTGAGTATVPSVTVSVSVNMWRDTTEAHVIFAQAPALIHFVTSTATVVYLSVLPGWMRPAGTIRGFQTALYASTSTARLGFINVSTDGRLVITNDEGNWDTDGKIFPFALTYPVK